MKKQCQKAVASLVKQPFSAFAALFIIILHTMNRKIMMIALISTISAGAFAQSAQKQTTKENISKAINAPDRKQNAAKADVFILNKKIVADSSTQKQSGAKAVRKSKTCCNKS